MLVSMSVQKMQQTDLVTSSVAAEYLGCSRSTVRRWANENRLPHVVMPSGQYRYRLSELKEVTTYVPISDGRGKSGAAS